MKLVMLVALMCVAVTWARPGDSYSDKWDNVKVDEILESDRLLDAYVKCLTDKGRCTPDGKDLKDTLPDALEHECAKCTAKQKEGADKVLTHIINKKPEVWKTLAAVYDPNNIYQQRYKDKIDAVKAKA